MIELEHVTFRYPRSEFELRVASMRVAERERVAVIGPSGSGKSTLLNLIAGIVQTPAGLVRVGSARLEGMKDAARRRFRVASIGFIFQNFELIDYLDVENNILHPYRICDSLRLDAAVRARAARLAEEAGIAAKLGRYPGELSQGEKQRAAICRALITRPSLVLADEATGNLDPANKQLILDLIFAAVAEHEATLLAVTHDHALLSRFDRVIDVQAFAG